MPVIRFMDVHQQSPAYRKGDVLARVLRYPPPFVRCTVTLQTICSSPSRSPCAASGGRPAYLPRRFAPAGKGALAVPSPYADLFSTSLPVEDGKGQQSQQGATAGTTAGTGRAASSDSASGTPGSGKLPLRRELSVRVGGTLSGGGPTLSITPQTAWAPNAENCRSVPASYGLIGNAISLINVRRLVRFLPHPRPVRLELSLQHLRRLLRPYQGPPPLPHLRFMRVRKVQPAPAAGMGARLVGFSCYGDGDAWLAHLRACELQCTAPPSGIASPLVDSASMLLCAISFCIFLSLNRSWRQRSPQSACAPGATCVWAF